MTGPDAKLGDKISLADGARKRRVEKAQHARVSIVHYRMWYNCNYVSHMIYLLYHVSVLI